MRCKFGSRAEVAKETLFECNKAKLYVPNEASCAEHPRDGHVVTVPSNDAVRDLDIVGVVQGDSGHFEVLEVDRPNEDVRVLVTVNA